MTETATTSNGGARDDTALVERVVIHGDLAKLSPEERSRYYLATCASLGLNPHTQPFGLLTFQGKMILYAKKDCAEQLRRRDRLSVELVHRETIEGVYVVTARASSRDGRHDEATGAVAIGGLKGDALANAFMRAETKAKRRVTLSICGLGVLDESEVDTMAGAEISPAPALLEAGARQAEAEQKALPAPKKNGSKSPHPAPDPTWERVVADEADELRDLLTQTGTKEEGFLFYFGGIPSVEQMPARWFAEARDLLQRRLAGRAG